MNLQLSMSEARRRLPALADTLSETSQVCKVTHGGKPVLAILSWEDYDGLRETLDILSDLRLAASLHRSARDIQRGKTMPWEEVKRRLRL